MLVWGQHADRNRSVLSNEGFKRVRDQNLTVVRLLDQSNLPRNENAKDKFRLRIRGLRAKSLISVTEWYQGVNSASKCFLKAQKCSRDTFPVITDVFWTNSDEMLCFLRNSTDSQCIWLPQTDIDPMALYHSPCSRNDS